MKMTIVATLVSLVLVLCMTVTVSAQDSACTAGCGNCLGQESNGNNGNYLLAHFLCQSRQTACFKSCGRKRSEAAVNEYLRKRMLLKRSNNVW